MQKADSPLFVNAIAKCFRVLDAFDGSKRQMTLVDIAQACDLDRSAVQRMVYTLEALGYLARAPGSKAYVLSSRLLKFSYNYVRNHELLTKATPFMQELRTTFGETVNLMELDHTEMVLIARVLSPHLLNVRVSVGSRFPTFCTSSGTAVLASLASSQRDAILDDSDFIARTPQTEIRRDKILARIEQAALKGYAITENQSAMGDITVAAAVIGPDGAATAAISISVPPTRWTMQAAQSKLAKHVQTAARALSVSAQ